jgi:GT2 family glycosyltransferase
VWGLSLAAKIKTLSMSQPFISLIIPTCNRPADLQRFLTDLQAQLLLLDDIEVLVSDDSRNTQTRTMVESEFPSVCWHQGPQRGAASNRNSAARAAKGEWLIFVDDDCIPRSTLLTGYEEKMKEVGSDAWTALEGATYALQPNSLLWEAPYNPDGGTLVSCNFAIPRSAFLKLAGFDERFPHDFEDVEFATRSKAQGLKVCFVKDAAVDHPLRPIPGPKKLANRWESRVISSYDFGAKPWQVFYYLSRHVLLVIISRFRGKKLNLGNIKAAAFFVAEFFFFLQKLPHWCRRYNRAPRSPFWSDPINADHLPRRFGL